MHKYESKPDQSPKKTLVRRCAGPNNIRPIQSGIQSILNLHRVVGNREMQRLLVAYANQNQGVAETGPEEGEVIRREALEPDPKAVTAGQLVNQWQQPGRSPGIWFDDWNDDERDNNKNEIIDDEPAETDGVHYGQTGLTAKICADEPIRRIDDPGCKAVKEINVVYKVCIDIPTEAYTQAGITSFPAVPGRKSDRDVGEVMRKLRWRRGWRIIRENGMNRLGFNGELADGDFVANGNHSGVGFGGKVIHLPGQSSRRANLGSRSYPSKPNDLYATDELWHGGSSFVARLLKPADSANPPGGKDDGGPGEDPGLFGDYKPPTGGEETDEGDNGEIFGKGPFLV